MVQEARETEKVEKRVTFGELLKTHVLDTIDPYRSTLTEAAEEEEKLGKPAKDRLEQHYLELSALKILLERLIDGEKFDPVVLLRKRLPDSTGQLSKDTYTVRLAPSEEKLKPGGSQNQLSLHVNIDALSETAAEIMHSVAIARQSPLDALQRYFKESVGQRLIVNSVNVSRTLNGEFLINPQAGVAFQWANGQREARVGGVTWVGYKPHFLMLPERSLGVSPFFQMQKTIINLSGRRQPAP